MPLYEYECESCGHRFEVIQRFSDKPIEKCPKCGGPVHKLQSAPAFQFKGTGWYITDYAKSGQKAGKGEGKTDGKGEGKTEAKTGTESKSDKTTSTPAKTSESSSSSSSGTSKSGD